MCHAPIRVHKAMNVHVYNVGKHSDNLWTACTWTQTLRGQSEDGPNPNFVHNIHIKHTVHFLKGVKKVTNVTLHTSPLVTHFGMYMYMYVLCANHL